MLAVAVKATGMITKLWPLSQGNQFRPEPGHELGAPEVRVIPDPLRLADSGVTARELASTVDAFNDGLRVAEITVDGERIDLVLKGTAGRVTQTQGIANLPGVAVALDAVETNIVFFDVAGSGADAATIEARLAERGVRIGAMGPSLMRAVTHLDVSRTQVEAAAAALRYIVVALAS